jgi:hypothetical protein
MNPNRKLWWFALVLLLVWDLGVHFYGAYQTEAHSKEPWIDVWFTVPAVITTQIERFLPPKRSSADLGGICIRFAGRMLD